MQSLNLVFQR